MDKIKHMSNEELKSLLLEYGFQPGPIVESTRTLYEKKLVEYERKKKTFPASSGSYESRQQYSTREYDDNQVHTLKIGKGNAKVNDGGKLQAQKSEQQSDPGTSANFKQLGVTQPCCAAHQIESNFGKEENPANVNQEPKKSIRETRKKTGQKKGARQTTRKSAGETTQNSIGETTQKIGAGQATQTSAGEISVRETTQKMDIGETTQGSVGETAQKMGTRRTRQKMGARETRQVHAGNLTSVCSVRATTIEVTQAAEVNVASLSTSRTGRAKPSMPSPQKRRKSEPKGGLKLAEANSSHYLAISLVPLLDKVPEERMVDLRHDLLNLISSYGSDAPPKLP